MSNSKILTLNIFYEEPDPDRWFKYDRYPRRIIRRIIRGKTKPGGVMMFALQLMQGLDILKIPYRLNDYGYAKKHPHEPVCIIGKPHVVFAKKWKNPIIFGPGTFSHPLDCPDLFNKYPVKKIITACDWMKSMFSAYYPENDIIVWPVGIDTEKWHSRIKLTEQSIDFLIYDKIRWDHDYYQDNLISPIINKITSAGLQYEIIRYGSYNHTDLIEKLSKCKAVIFLCEHETQGLAYQQILATNTPIMAWDREGYWQDPEFYPKKAKFEPVSSVPYWNNRCGVKFKDFNSFESVFENFIILNSKNTFSPRQVILDNLTLEICAQKYYNIVEALSINLKSVE